MNLDIEYIQIYRIRKYHIRPKIPYILRQREYSDKQPTHWQKAHEYYTLSYSTMPLTAGTTDNWRAYGT